MGFWDYVSAFGTNAGNFGRGAAFGATYGMGATNNQADFYGVNTRDFWTKGGFETGAMFNMFVGQAGPGGRYIASAAGNLDKAFGYSQPGSGLPQIGTGEEFNDPMQQAMGGWYGENGYDGMGSFDTNMNGYSAGFNGTNYQMPDLGGSPYGNLDGAYGAFGGGTSDYYGSGYGTGSPTYGSFGTNDNGWDVGSTGTNYSWGDSGSNGSFSDFGTNGYGTGSYGVSGGASNNFGSSYGTDSASYGSFGTNSNGWDMGSSGTNYSWGDSGSNGSFSDFGSMDFSGGGDW